MRRLAIWAPIGAAVCLAAAAAYICYKARKDVRGIYELLGDDED